MRRSLSIVTRPIRVFRLFCEGGVGNLPADYGRFGRQPWSTTGALTTANPSGRGEYSFDTTSSTGYLLRGVNNPAMALPSRRPFTLRMLLRGNASFADKYVVSLQDATPTAAGTQFALAFDGASRPVIVCSNGSTRSVIATASSAPSTGVWYESVFTRRGDTFEWSFDGTVYCTATYANELNHPTSQDLRFGKPLYGVNNGLTGQYDDMELLVH